MNIVINDFLWAVAVIALAIGMAVAGVLAVAQYADYLARQLNTL